MNPVKICFNEAHTSAHFNNFTHFVTKIPYIPNIKVKIKWRLNKLYLKLNNVVWRPVTS